MHHLGRITYSSMDYQEQATTEGEIRRHILEVQNVYYIDAHHNEILRFSQKVNFSQVSTAYQELLIVSDSRHLIKPKEVKTRLTNVKMDYYFNPAPPHEPLTTAYTIRTFLIRQETISAQHDSPLHFAVKKRS